MFFKKKNKTPKQETPTTTELVHVPSFVIQSTEQDLPTKEQDLPTKEQDLPTKEQDLPTKEEFLKIFKFKEDTPTDTDIIDTDIVEEERLTEEEFLNIYREDLKKEALEIREDLVKELTRELTEQILEDLAKESSEETKEERKQAFKAIYGVETMREVLAVFRLEYNEVKNKSLKKSKALFKKYSYAIYFLYSPSSIRNNLVKFKKVIQSEEGKYQTNVLEEFEIMEIYAPIKAHDLERKKALKKEVIEENAKCQDPSNIEDVVNRIKELDRVLKEKDYVVKSNQDENRIRSYRIMAILALSTGRRFTELAKTLNISKKGNSYYFEGLLKGNKERIKAHFIHLDYKSIKNYLKELRSDLNTSKMEDVEVNNKYAKVFNNAFKRLGFTNIKSLRHQYAIAGSQLFREEGEAIEDAITRILGHKEVFASSLNYT